MALQVVIASVLETVRRPGATMVAFFFFVIELVSLRCIRMNNQCLP